MEVAVDQLTKHFGTTVAVDRLSTVFESGALTALLGPSGCGKSTLLFMLAGILPVTEGLISFGGQEVTDLAPDKRGVGLVFQNYALYPHLTVLENICFPLSVQRVPRSERRERAAEMAKLVHVDELLQRKPSQLSGGQQQRVAIARALVKRPQVLLLDEPLSNLDARLRLEMRDELRRIQQETGITTVLVTHDQDEALSVADSVLVMRSGVVQQSGTPIELYRNPTNQFVAEFLGMPPVNTVGGVVDGDGVVLVGGTTPIAVESLAGVAAGTPITLAIRPDSATISTDDRPGSTSARVTRVHASGREQATFVEVAGVELRLLLPAGTCLAPDDEISLAFNELGLFVFDATGARLA